ncbi:hypothetical protein Javan383_0057 [Streptococcus phage Javan383]|nr:hypothetical protein Javan383_0057 [Streptococcus phage Javan383]
MATPPKNGKIEYKKRHIFSFQILPHTFALVGGEYGAFLFV